MFSKLPWKIQEVDEEELAGGAKVNVGYAVDIVSSDGCVVAYEVKREDAELIVLLVNRK